MNVRIISKSGVLPAYETEGSAGMDLRAYLDAPVTLAPMERALIPTGIFLAVPKRRCAQGAGLPSNTASVL